MDFRNDQVLFDEKDGGLYSPRWYRVTVCTDEHSHAFATAADFRCRHLDGNEAERVDIIRCECGHEYAVVHRANVLTPRCRVCDNAQRAIEQRRRRARARTLATACTVCGAPLSARRSSRKYCSPACRQRAHRHRSIDIEAMS